MRIVVSTETTLSFDLRAFNICMFRTCNWPNPDRLYWGLARPTTAWSRFNCESESYSHRGDRGVNGFFACGLSEWPSIRKERMPMLQWSLGWSSSSRRHLTCAKRRKSWATILNANHFQKILLGEPQMRQSGALFNRDPTQSNKLLPFPGKFPKVA